MNRNEELFNKLSSSLFSSETHAAHLKWLALEFTVMAEVWLNKPDAKALSDYFANEANDANKEQDFARAALFRAMASYVAEAA